MNFWRASILPLVFAAAAFLGLCAMNGHLRTEMTAAAGEKTVFSTEVSCEAAPKKSQAADEASFREAGPEKDPFCAAKKKRTRKCWRPDRHYSFVLVPVKSPAEASRSRCLSLELHIPPTPAGSDLLFIVGGYTRLFQKG